MAIFKNKISEKDKKRFEEIALSSVNKSTDSFNVEYIAPLIRKYESIVDPLIQKARRLRTPKEIRDISITISANTKGANSAIEKLYNSFNRTIYSDRVFAKLGVTNPLAKRAILSNSISLFNEYTTGALSRMNTETVSSIRSIQTDLMREEARISRLVSNGTVLKKDRADLLEDFERRLIKNNKKYKILLEDGLTVTYKNGAKHALDEYVEMSVKTTIMNVDRNAVTMQEMINDRRVSEYYKKDKTQYKTGIRRQVCKEIMSNKFKGVSLIAHDAAAAALFGILTLDQAKARDAFGVNCHHGIKSLSNKFYNRIDTLLTLNESEVLS